MPRPNYLVVIEGSPSNAERPPYSQAGYTYTWAGHPVIAGLPFHALDDRSCRCFGHLIPMVVSTDVRPRSM